MHILTMPNKLKPQTHQKSTKKKIRKPDLVVHNVGIGDHHGAVLVSEGCLAIQHLVSAHSERPPVALSPKLALRVVTIHLHQNLWADVVWCAHWHVGHGLKN